MAAFTGGGIGGVGRIGGALRAASGGPDFNLSNSSAATSWDNVVFGQLVAVNVTGPVTYRLVDEDAGIAVRNG